MKKYVKCIWDLFLSRETFGPEFIRHRQKLAPAECLQFSTTSVLMGILALRNCLFLATVNRRYRTFPLVT